MFVYIVRNKKNSFVVEGKNFDLNKIIDRILFENTKNNEHLSFCECL